jgi:hypothetical protein
VITSWARTCRGVEVDTERLERAAAKAKKRGVAEAPPLVVLRAALIDFD